MSTTKRVAPGAVPAAPLDPLPRGTLCFLTRVSSPRDVVGRVVEVVAGPREEYGDGPGPFYDIRAAWIGERFPDRDLIVVREQLIPIGGAGSAVQASTVDALHVERAREAT